MRNARAHKLQWSGPTVHSSTVLLPYGGKLGYYIYCISKLSNAPRLARERGHVHSWNCALDDKLYIRVRQNIKGQKSGETNFFITHSDFIVFIHFMNYLPDGKNKHLTVY